MVNILHQILVTKITMYSMLPSIRQLKTKTQFLQRPFKFSVIKVFRMEAEDFRFKMQVVWRGLQLEPGGALGFFVGGYVPPETPNWHPVLKKFPLKLIPRSRNGPIFHTPF